MPNTSGKGSSSFRCDKFLLSYLHLLFSQVKTDIVGQARGEKNRGNVTSYDSSHVIKTPAFTRIKERETVSISLLFSQENQRQGPS